MNLERALSISDYHCDERTAELTWLAEKASTRKAIVEVGSWKGCTARAMADNTIGTVYAVDTFEGSVGEEAHQKLADRPGWLYEEFKRNTNDLNNLWIMRMTSLEASDKFKKANFRFDMIFLDASHDYDSIKADILAWKPLLVPGGLFCGHDRQWDGVAKAINELVPGHDVGAGAIWYAC